MGLRLSKTAIGLLAIGTTLGTGVLFYVVKAFSGGVEIHVSREATIAAWDVAVGDRVHKGQRLARSTSDSVSAEEAVALAGYKQNVGRAENIFNATNQFHDVYQKELNDSGQNSQKVLQTTLAESRDAVKMLVGKDCATAGSPDCPLSEASSVKLKQKEVYYLSQKILNYYLDQFGLDFRTTQPDDYPLGTDYRFRPLVGSAGGIGQSEFVSAAKALVSELKNPSALPETATLNYLKAAQRLALNTTALKVDPDNPYTTGLLSDELSTVRESIGSHQSDFLNALRDYYEAKNAVQNAQDEYEKTEATAQQEALDKKLEIDKQLKELEENMAQAKAESTRAQAVYRAYISTLPLQDIIAPRDGTISQIFSQVGEHVRPIDAIAVIN